MSEQLGIINNPPYFDDFDPNKNYSKILFRPGRAVQARELTQIQTILQNQISALGDKLLTSPIVSGGEAQITSVKYLKFASITVGGSVVNPAFLKDKTVEVRSGSTVAKLKVIEVESPSYEPRYVLYFTEISGYSLNSVASLVAGFSAVVTDETTLEQSGVVFNLEAWGDGIPLYGDALLVSLGNGIFYKDGYFVVSDKPIYLGLSTKTQLLRSGSFYRNFTISEQTHRIGLVLTTEFITTEEDPTLYDPSAGYYNYAAPGGDRLKIIPKLSLLSEVKENEVYVEIVDSRDGQTTIIPTANPESAKPEPEKCCQSDIVVRPPVIDIIDSVDDPMRRVVIVGDGEVVVNDVNIELVEPKRIPIPELSNERRLNNQALGGQCLSDAVLVRATLESPLFSGVSGGDYGGLNTNYFGSGKIRKLFSDETVRLEIVSCDGLKIGCLTPLDISQEDENSYRLYYNELQSYVASIPSENLFAEACTISLDGETVFSIYSNRVLTCADTVPNGKKRLVYKIPRGNNITNIIDNDYMITRDFVADIVGGEAVFNMDVPNGVFNDNTDNGVGDPSLFTVVINGKQIPLVNNNSGTHISVISATQVKLVLSSSPGISYPTAGKVYMIAKVRFVEKAASNNLTPTPHRKKILREVRGSYTQDLSTNPTISLGFSDVYEIRSVTISGFEEGYSVDDFIFDNGQRNDRYDHATLTLDPSKQSPSSDTVEIIVVFRYFEHQPIAPGFYGPITVNSYGFDQSGNPIANFHGLDLNGNRMTLGYKDIPNFLDRVSGEVLSLSDCIDYRMFRTEEGYIENGLNKSSVLRGRFFPSPDATAAVEAGYIFKMPRTDLLVVRQDGTCAIVPGVPSEMPVPSEYPSDAIVISEISVPGIPTSSNDYNIKITPLRGIGLSEMNDIQNRVRDLENLLSLKTMESRAKPQTGNTRNEFLTGLIVDDFGGHYVGDVANDEYNCSMDFSTGELRSPFTTKFASFVPALWSSGEYSSQPISDYYVMAPEISEDGAILLSNSQGTEEISINSFGAVNWHGYLSIDRPYNLWVDQNTKPVVRNNQRGRNDAWEAGGSAVQKNSRSNGFGTHWGFWKSLWFGDKFIKTGSVEKDRAAVKNFSDAVTSQSPSRFSRGINKESLFEQSKNDLSSGGFSITDTKNGRYSDTSLNFFCPEDYIIVKGYSLKPNSSFNVYFEDMEFPVSSSRVTTLSGESLANLSTDSKGYLEFRLTVPAGSYLSGNKVVKVVETGNQTNRSFASAIYQNVGGDWKNRINQKEKTVDLEKLSIGRTDVFLQNQQTLRKESLVSNGIVQTFYVDAVEYPEGLILKDFTLYISKKDGSLPISVEIRRFSQNKIDMFNIIRNSRVHLNPDQISENVDNLFPFSSPVYLPPGQYALVVRSNSSNYKIHISQNGLPRVDNGVVSTTDVLARPVANAGVYIGSGSVFATPETNKTLRCGIRRRVFDNRVPSGVDAKLWSPSDLDGSLPDSRIPGTESFDILYLADNNQKISSGSVVYSLERFEKRKTVGYQKENVPTPNAVGRNTGLDGSIQPNTDIELSSNVGDRSMLSVVVSTERSEISPIVDLRKLGILYIKNRISSLLASSGILENESKNFAGFAGSSMKYITRRVDVDLGANIIRATFDAKLPGNLNILVYTKVLFEGDTDFDNRPYIQMTKVFGEESTARERFKEFSYEYDGTANQRNIVSFCVKIIVLADVDDSSDVPKIKNLSVISAVR